MCPVAKQDPKTTLLGSGLLEETTCLRWASFTDYELLPPIMAWINPIIGRAPSSPEILAQLEENCELTVRAVEKEISGKTFLVGDALTIADLFVVSGLARGYQFVSCLSPINAAESPNLELRFSQRHGQQSILSCTSIT